MSDFLLEIHQIKFSVHQTSWLDLGKGKGKEKERGRKGEGVKGKEKGEWAGKRKDK